MWFVHLLIIWALWNLHPIFGVFYIILTVAYYSDKSNKEKKQKIEQSHPSSPSTQSKPHFGQQIQPQFRSQPPTARINGSVIYVEPANSSQIERPTHFGVENDYFYTAEVGKRLGISGEDKELIRRLWSRKTNFLSIQQCEDETIKLYLSVLRALKNQDSLGPIATKNFIQKLFSEKSPSIFDSNFYSLETQSFVNNLYKLSENTIRKSYRSGRKLDEEYYLNSIRKQVDNETILFIQNELNSYQPGLPTDNTKRSVSLLTPSAWREELKKIKRLIASNGYSEEIQKEIVDILNANNQNPQFPDLCFEICKELSKHQQVFSLMCYLLYKRSTLTTGQQLQDLPASVKKTIFGTDEERFQEFLSLPIDLSLDELQIKISDIFKEKRKKIIINSDVVEQKRHLDEQVVAEISEILSESEIIENTVRLTSIDAVFGGATSETITYSELQKDLIRQFVTTNFKLSQEVVDEFSKRNNQFSSMLISEINEVFYEKYEDTLISEENNFYIITEQHRETILTL